MPDIASDPAPPDQVRPVFDADAETLPLPNDAALEPDGTLPDLEGAGDETAEGRFLSWLGGLHGWLPATSIEIPFNGELDEETLDGAVQLYEVRDGEEGTSLEPLEIAPVDYRTESVEVSGDDGEIRSIDGSVVTVTPKNPITPRSEYAVVVTKSLEGADGEPVVEPQPIFFAGSRDPLVDEEGRKTVESLPSNEAARDLEDLRTSLQPVFAGAAEEGIERSQVAMAFRWSTVREPRTVLDPEAPRLPLPNSAGLDDDGTFPDSALPASGESTAQGYLESYLGRLHGWPPLPQEGTDYDNPTTCAPSDVAEGAEERLAICAPVDGDLNGETVAKSNVELWGQPKFGGEAFRVDLRRVTYRSEEQVIELVPSEPLPRRTRYVALATDDVEGANGYSLELPAAVWMAIQPYDVFEDGSSKVGRLSDDQARQIQQLRPFMQKAATLVRDETTVTLSELGAIWTWKTWTDTFVQFDPASGTLAFPNEFVRRGAEGRVSLPAPGGEGLEADLIRDLNERRGFATTAGGWLPVDGPLKEPEEGDDWVPPDGLQFWYSEPTPQRYDASRYEIRYREEWDQVVFEPTRPWRRDAEIDPTADGALNLGIVTNALQGANGHSVVPSPAFVFLRSPYELYDEENEASTVEALDDDTARQLESAREEFSALFDVAAQLLGDKLGIEEREDIKMAWGFHPSNSTKLVQGYRARARAILERYPGRAKVEGSESSLVDPASLPESDPLSNLAGDVGQIQRRASYHTADFRGANGRRLVGFWQAERQPVGVSVVLPNYEDESDCAPPFDVVIGQHGLGGSRIDAGRALGPELADRCLALVAVDFPRHGGRAPGASSLHPQTTPDSSGAEFLSQDLLRSKTQVVQSITDITYLVEIVRRGGLEGAIPSEPPGDAESWFASGSDMELGYAGYSLGGFVGVPVLATDDAVQVGVTMGAGGGLSEMLTQGNLAGDIVEALEEAGFEEGSFERYRAKSLIQWAAEPIDPLSFAPFLTGDAPAPTVPDGDFLELEFDSDRSPPFASGGNLPTNEVLFQMASASSSGDDSTVPNATTRRLAEAAGRTVEGSIYEGPHGVFFETDEESDVFQEARCARRQAAAWLATGLADDRDAGYPDELAADACRASSE